ncbi:Golgi to ER traffic protein 4 homolog [Chrysoperla carnea]|uniref:Golgi to ER traffic protein 4 homolog n=1 Tax=Chrysoperla carnea TaxID=189513 RepID=UPI001D06CBC6|nr:Golgi to ER traffic protein 4 homolog [Chrysoperla carnea]
MRRSFINLFYLSNCCIIYNMASAKNNVRGVSRVLTKLEASVSSGNYYEAHQMYRTLYFRYLGQKKYSEALDLLYNGAHILLQHGQLGSGADLAILYVDVLIQSDTPVLEEIFERIAKLFAAIGPTIPERDTFLTNAIKWSQQNNKRGHAKLHQKFADIFWKEENYVMSRHHFLYSSDGRGCAHMLIELHRTRGYLCETDLFIAQAVLQYLCLNNKLTATEVFKTYTEVHPNIKTKQPPYALPLLNFLAFLLQAVESKNLAAYTILCEKYQPSLNRDPSYAKYLDKIGQLYLGVPPPRQRANGLFGNLIQNLLSGLDMDSDDDGDHPGTFSRPSTSSFLAFTGMGSSSLD